MSEFSAFVFAVVLTGLFSAMAELVLPWRTSGTGRMVRALCATVLVALFARPLLDLPRLLAALPAPDAEGTRAVSAGALEEAEGCVADYAMQSLQEQMQKSARELFSGEVSVKVFCGSDITDIRACIYWGGTEAGGAAEGAERLAALYGIPCTVVSEGAGTDE